MKIAYIYQFLTLGGVSVQLRNRMAGLRNRDVEVGCFFLYDRGGRDVLEETGQIVVNSDVDALVESALSWAPDFLVTIDTPHVAGLLGSGRSSSPVWIAEVHTTTRMVRYLATMRNLDRVRGFIVPSQYMKSVVVDRYGISADRVRVVPNCVDGGLFARRTPASRPARRICCWIGKLDIHKNWREFVDICRLVARERDDTEFWLVGGDTASRRIRRQLLSALSETGIMGRFRWIDRVEYDRMPNLFSVVAESGGVHVITSRDESFGMTALEAMFCRCPVVCSRVGALPELVKPDETGLSYELGDVKTAAGCVLRLLDEPGTGAGLSARAHELVTRTFTPEPVGALYRRTLEEIAR